MKKITKLILSVMMLLLPNSCNKKDDRYLIEGNYDINSSVELDLNEYESKITNEDSFILYVSNNTCSACILFEKVLASFISNTHSVIYKINDTIFENNSKKLKVSSSPSLIFFKDGSPLKIIRYDKQESVFKNEENLSKCIFSYVYIPKLLTISEASLDNKIASNESFILYIGWNKCGDCKLLHTRILNDYLKEDSSNTIYYLESDGYRKDKPSKMPDFTDTSEDNLINIENWNKWISFASKYNFVSYENGKVPTLQKYENGIVKEMLVYHNDKIENGVVSVSFFNDLIGKTMSDEQLLEEHDKRTLEFLKK